MKEITDTMKNQFKSIVDELVSNGRTEMQEDVDTFKRILLTLLVIYIFLLFFFYIFGIYPNASKLNTEIKITIKMLNMIPLNVILEISSIRNYLYKLAKR